MSRVPTWVLANIASERREEMNECVDSVPLGVGSRLALRRLRSTDIEYIRIMLYTPTGNDGRWGTIYSLRFNADNLVTTINVCVRLLRKIIDTVDDAPTRERAFKSLEEVCLKDIEP